MLRECPIDHRCMTGIDVDGVLGRSTRLASGARMRPRGFPRSRRHDHRGARLPRSRSIAVAFFPCRPTRCARLNRAGFAVVVVTNQAGIARGIFDEAFVAEAHAHLDALLAAGGARIDGYYYCPHHPDGAVAGYAPRVRLPQARARA